MDQCDHPRVDQSSEGVWECEVCTHPFYPEERVREAEARADIAMDVSADLLWRVHQRAVASGSPGIEVTDTSSSSETEQDSCNFHTYDSDGFCTVCGYTPFIAKQDSVEKPTFCPQNGCSKPFGHVHTPDKTHGVP